MGKYRGVVLFDYDFTTVDKDEGVPAASPKTIESLERLKENVVFSYWEKKDAAHTVVRFATSWATKMEDVKKLAALL